MAAFFTCLQLAGQPFPFAGYENGTSKCRVWQIAFPLLICMHSLLCFSSAPISASDDASAAVKLLFLFFQWKTFSIQVLLRPTQELNAQNMTKSICNQCEMRNEKDSPLSVQAALNIHVIITWNEHSWYLLPCRGTCRWVMRSERSNLFTWAQPRSRSRSRSHSPLSLYDSRKEWRHSSLSLDLDLIKLITLSSSGKSNKFLLLCVISYLCLSVIGVICMWMWRRGCGLDFCWYLLTCEWYF